MSTLTTPVPHTAPPVRPNPGPRIAPPQPTSSVPWAELLDESFPGGNCIWVRDESGALLPVPTGDAVVPSRRLFGRRRG
jgi:hypothetical protein